MLSEPCFRAQLVIHEQRQLYDYWLERAGARPMPARRDIDPGHIMRLLPSIGLVEVTHGAAKAWFRLAGTRLRDIYGIEITGRLIADLATGPRGEYWREIHETIVRTGLPMHGAIRGPIDGREHVLMFWLRLPLSDGEGVNRILCLDTPVPAAGALGDAHAVLTPALPVTSRRAGVYAKACA